MKIFTKIISVLLIFGLVLSGVVCAEPFYGGGSEFFADADIAHTGPFDYNPSEYDGADYSDSHVIVRITNNGGTVPARMPFSNNYFGVEVEEVEKIADINEPSGRMGIMSVADDIMLLKLKDKSKNAVREAIDTLNNAPEVLYAEPDYIVSISDTTPNDPSFSSLYGMKKLKAPTAWDVSTGSHEVVVAVIDTGIDYTHPDLADNIWENPNVGSTGYANDIHGWNFIGNNNDIMDDNKHGTHVAGTIGAVGNNGIGVAGVNWQVKLMGLKTFDAAGQGYISHNIKAVEYACNAGAHISNNSYGGNGYSQAFKDVIAQSDHLFVAAAGNSRTNNDTRPHYPSGYDCDNIISVASTTETDALSSFSNYGINTVHLAAPGSNIYSTLPNNQYGRLSGTSMATPHAAGAAALIKSAAPNLSNAEIKERLILSSDPVASLANRVMSGGRINVFNALSPVTSIPIESIQLSDQSLELYSFSTYTMTTAILPTNTTQMQTVWTSSNPNVARVSLDGVITSYEKGRTVIKVASNYNDSIADECLLTVVEEPGKLTYDFAGGDGTESNPYQVSTPAQLNNVRKYMTRHFIQTNDIDMSAATSAGGAYYNNGKGWTSIGTAGNNVNYFQGNYNGSGYSIIGLQADGRNISKSYIGLFALSYLGTIQNVNIRGGILKNGYYMGAVVAYNVGIIKKCSNTADLTIEEGVQSRDVGGITGINNYSNDTNANTVITDCYNSGKIEYLGYHYINVFTTVGGIVGLNRASLMINCRNSGDIIVKPTEYAALYIGGVVGHSGISTSSKCNVLLKNCYNTGNISLAGPNYDERQYQIGGVAGEVNSSGGRSWSTKDVEVDSCYNTGDVTAYNVEASVGGVTGSLTYSIMTNCFNTGKVSSTQDVMDKYVRGHGGITGANDYSLVEKSYNVGAVSSPSFYSGYIIGRGRTGYSEALSSFYLDVDDKKGFGGGRIDNVGKTEAKNKAQMRTQMTYSNANWDFKEVWGMDSKVNGGYPYLISIPMFDILVAKNTLLKVNDEISGSLSIKIDNYTNVSANVLAIMAVYDADKLVYFDCVQIEIDNENAVDFDGIEIKNAVSKNYIVKVLLWDTLVNMNQLCNPKEFPLKASVLLN